MLYSERLQEIQEIPPSAGLRDRKDVCTPEAPLCSRKRATVNKQALIMGPAISCLNVQIRGLSAQSKPHFPGAASSWQESSQQRAPVHQALANI